jgi:hypothetical protein
MNLTTSRITLALTLAVVSAASLTGCADTSPAEPAGRSATTAPSESQDAAAPAKDSESDTAAQLAYLIEEEKLAHDVYLVLGETWGMKIFTNISASESAHQDAVASLLVAYGIPDPRQDTVGDFTDADLQTLYDSLIAQGTQSRAAAIDVGIAIEETDIADLTDALDTAPSDVAKVLERLLAGSQNHLEAFERQS